MAVASGSVRVQENVQIGKTVLQSKVSQKYYLKRPTFGVCRSLARSFEVTRQTAIISQVLFFMHLQWYF